MGQFASMLPDFGWDVTVLTARHDQGAGIDTEFARYVRSRADVIETRNPTSAISVRGKPVVKTGWKGLARKVARSTLMTVLFPDREILWAPAALAAGRRALRDARFDAVLATHGPATDLVVGAMLAREHRLPLVLDFRDLWATLEIPFFATPVHQAAARLLEGSLVRKASRVVAVAPLMAESLADAHGIERTRTVAITNGFDPADVARAQDTRTNEGPFRLVYSGSIHAHYNLDSLWTAVRELAQEGLISPSTFRMVFVGNLSVNDVRTNGVEPFVEISPFVPRAQVFDSLGKADALLVVETPGYYARYGYAAKVFDYVLTGKPVVGLVEHGGNTQRLLEASGLGHTADPRDTPAIKRALTEVLGQRRQPARSVDINIPPLRDFNRRHLVEKLAAVLDEVVTTEPEGRW